MTLEELLWVTNSFVTVEICNGKGDPLCPVMERINLDYAKYAEWEVTDVNVIYGRLVVNIKTMTYKTWAEKKLAELMHKGKENWDQDDFEAYAYIEECFAESGYYDDDN